MINLQETLKNNKLYYSFKNSKDSIYRRPKYTEHIKGYKENKIFYIETLSDLISLEYLKFLMDLNYTFREGFSLSDEILPEFVDIRDLYRHYKIDYEIIKIKGIYFVQLKGSNNKLLSLIEHTVIDRNEFIDNTLPVKALLYYEKGDEWAKQSLKLTDGLNEDYEIFNNLQIEL